MKRLTAIPFALCVLALFAAAVLYHLIEPGLRSLEQGKRHGNW